MATVDCFEDLIIWQEAKELTLLIYTNFKQSKDFGFRDQIQRAAVSIMNNIAEGFERGTDPDFIKFLFFSKASAGEVRSMLYLARELNYLEKNEADNLIIKTRRISGSIGNFIKYLKQSKNKDTKDIKSAEFRKKRPFHPLTFFPPDPSTHWLSDPNNPQNP